MKLVNVAGTASFDLLGGDGKAFVMKTGDQLITVTGCAYTDELREAMEYISKSLRVQFAWLPNGVKLDVVEVVDEEEKFEG